MELDLAGLLSLSTKLGFKELLLQNKNESYEKIQKLLTFFLFNDNLHKK